MQGACLHHQLPARPGSNISDWNISKSSFILSGALLLDAVVIRQGQEADRVDRVPAAGVQVRDEEVWPRCWRLPGLTRLPGTAY